MERRRQVELQQQQAAVAKRKCPVCQARQPAAVLECFGYEQALRWHLHNSSRRSSSPVHNVCIPGAS